MITPPNNERHPGTSQFHSQDIRKEQLPIIEDDIYRELWID
ncbi:hypothetical protein CHCC14821_0138 [Bacillus paralicheniformis]|nr:hypothetical protein CHCC14821_0138 [Bacillus paralicheniformis]